MGPRLWLRVVGRCSTYHSLDSPPTEIHHWIRMRELRLSFQTLRVQRRSKNIRRSLTATRQLVLALKGGKALFNQDFISLFLSKVHSSQMQNKSLTKNQHPLLHQIMTWQSLSNNKNPKINISELIYKLMRTHQI